MTAVLLADSALRSFHASFAWAVVGLNAIAGTWALVAIRSEPLRRRELWWFTAVAQVAIVVQVLVGVALRNQVFGDVEDPPHLRMHMFYGFIALFTMAIMYSYRSQLRGRVHLLYGFGGLFLMGLALRAVYLG